VNPLQAAFADNSGLLNGKAESSLRVAYAEDAKNFDGHTWQKILDLISDTSQNAYITFREGNASTSVNTTEISFSSPFPNECFMLNITVSPLPGMSPDGWGYDLYSRSRGKFSIRTHYSSYNSDAGMNTTYIGTNIHYLAFGY
jgi:hypothetical protein